MNNRKKFAISILIALLPLSLSLAQSTGRVDLRIDLSRKEFSSGSTGETVVTFYVPENFHITGLEYGLFFLKFQPPKGITFAEPVFPPAVEFEQEKVFKGAVKISSAFNLAKELSTGEYKVNLNYGYQICSETGDRICYLPQTGDTSFTILISAEGKDSRFAQTGDKGGFSGKSLEGGFQQGLARGSALTFLLVFLAGLFSSFTPCVYPMIPITVGYIGARAQGQRLKGLILSLFLTLGLATVYSILGLIAAVTGSVFGSFTQHPMVVIAVALVFALMGASMLGAFDINLPSRFQSKLQTQKRGYLGAYLVGMITGLVAVPCVGPILIALLTFVAQSGNLILGFFLLFAYALGIGVLFILIGTFTGALTALPGAGAWMNTIKKFFGILLISGALIFLKPLLPLNFYYLLWGMVLIAVGVFIGGLDAVDRDTTNLKRWCKVLGILALISGAVILISGLKSSLISPSQSTGLIVNKTERTGISWKLNDVDGAFKLANEQEAKVVMDFYADWCSACRELDEKTWSNPELASKFNKWIFLKIDLTRPDLEMMKVQKKYRIQGLPTVIFLNENEQELGRFSGFKSASEVMQIMTNL